MILAHYEPLTGALLACKKWLFQVDDINWLCLLSGYKNYKNIYNRCSFENKYGEI